LSTDYKTILDRLKEQKGFRHLRPLDHHDGPFVRYKGKRLLNLTSNDYLGLGGDRELLKSFYKQTETGNLIDRFGLGSCSSRLLTGDNPAATELEDYIVDSYQREACLLFNSGYHANIGVLPALTQKNDLILSDKLNHASIHDGLRLSRAKYIRYNHCDYDHLRSILLSERHDYNRVLIVTESVFSMDGDCSDLSRLVELKQEFEAMLYLDEAHAVGLYGPKGLGKADESGLAGEIDIIMGTFGKALAGLGAYVVCNKIIRDFLVNHSRSLIFTTALPPVVLSWNKFVFQRVGALADKRVHLQKLSNRLRAAFVGKKLNTGGTTNIIPVIIGDNGRCIDLAAVLREKGFLIFPVRPPAVPAGTARFRLSLCASMDWSQINELPDLISTHMVLDS